MYIFGRECDERDIGIRIYHFFRFLPYFDLSAQIFNHQCLSKITSYHGIFINFHHYTRLFPFLLLDFRYFLTRLSFLAKVKTLAFFLLERNFPLWNYRKARPPHQGENKRTM